MWPFPNTYAPPEIWKSMMASHDGASQGCVRQSMTAPHRGVCKRARQHLTGVREEDHDGASGQCLTGVHVAIVSIT